LGEKRGFRLKKRLDEIIFDLLTTSPQPCVERNFAQTNGSTHKKVLYAAIDPSKWVTKAVL
jgi:hypothetical protein